jgi:hypothetical protein
MHLRFTVERGNGDRIRRTKDTMEIILLKTGREKLHNPESQQCE